jgi:hypothetical protein
MILEAVLRTMEGVSRECGRSAGGRYSMSVGPTHPADDDTDAAPPPKKPWGK